jgi:transglutaminase-like putative cysteine protease
MGGEVFAWHGYAEVWLEDRWVQASPTFDAPLCQRMGVAPLVFDGRNDAHLQAYDAAGRTFMSYNRLHGAFHDVPAKFLAAEMTRLYPRAYEAIGKGEVD